MTDGRRQTWHYGLVARWWAEVNRPDPAELAYYGEAIRRWGEPALDLGCGAGRLLVPLLAEGPDVDGVDVSPDMLALARSSALAAGIDPDGRLVAQAFHQLDLPRRYGTIYCCDSFGIGGGPDLDPLALRRVCDHLEREGAFVFSYEPPTSTRSGVDDRPLPRPWPDEGDRAVLADGDEIELLIRLAARDLVVGRDTLEMRARLWHEGEVVAEEEGRIELMQYPVETVMEMLRSAGFTEVTAEGRYDHAVATPDAGTVVFIARRS